jgi:hypothetical protein
VMMLMVFSLVFVFSAVNSDASQRNLYWSIDYSWAHIVALSTESDYSQSSEQYKWFVNDMEKVDRSKTPWVIVQFHRPFYNSNYGTCHVFATQH